MRHLPRSCIDKEIWVKQVQYINVGGRNSIDGLILTRLDSKQLLSAVLTYADATQHTKIGRRAMVR
jgi:hypothetical protein